MYQNKIFLRPISMEICTRIQQRVKTKEGQVFLMLQVLLQDRIPREINHFWYFIQLSFRLIQMQTETPPCVGWKTFFGKTNEFNTHTKNDTQNYTLFEFRLPTWFQLPPLKPSKLFLLVCKQKEQKPKLNSKVKFYSWSNQSQ